VHLLSKLRKNQKVDNCFFWGDPVIQIIGRQQFGVPARKTQLKQGQKPSELRTLRRWFAVNLGTIGANKVGTNCACIGGASSELHLQFSRIELFTDKLIN
jgi:hypothetical protein